MSALARRYVLTFAAVSVAQPLHAQTTVDSAHASVAYLKTAMDQFHNRFPVYDDVSSAGNHFHVFAKLPSGDAAVTMNGSWTNNPRSGATAIRCVYSPLQPFAGFYFQNGTLTGTQTTPLANWGTVPSAGINLTGATALTFWARGAVGGERIEFFVAGVGRDAGSGVAIASYPDSSPRRPAVGTTTTLTTSWQRFTIDLSGMDLSYVLGGFAWVATTALNPNGATFFLDDIQYELGAARLEQRLNEPRFLRSFTTLPLQPDPFDDITDGDIDFVLRNVAFTYDNALAVLAFLAHGSPDSIRRARLIGDAFIYAMQHDRTYNDNRACDAFITNLGVDGARLRTAYAAGDIALPPGWSPNNRAGTVSVPGFYVDATETFYEVEQQAVDVGNNAWAIIALRALYDQTAQTSYLDAACKLANFIRSFRQDVGTYQGFTGGVMDPETTPTLRPWASSEHNLDVYAAFSALYRTTGEARWQQDAEHARHFVEAMWDSNRNCFLAGTIDPSTRNTTSGTLPLDVQAWIVLAVPDVLRRYPAVIGCAEANHLNAADTFTGFDFNEDKDGVWFEGTGQMAVAYIVAGQPSNADTYRLQLRNAQVAPFGDQAGIVASSHDGLSTGFLTAGNQAFKYFRRLHAGATAWNLFAQLGVNPYYISLPPAPPDTIASRFIGSSATLTWSAVPGALGYEVARSSDRLNFTIIASPTFATLTDFDVTMADAYLYRVRTRSADGRVSNWSSADVMTAIQFTDDPLTIGTVVKAAHINELRSAANAVRALAGLQPVSFSHEPVIRALHVMEVRAAVGSARSSLGLPELMFARPILEPGVSIISAVDFTELRDAVR